MAIRSNQKTVRACVVLLFFAASSSAALAGEVYKCKGAKGETIYQNLPCPAGAKALAHGSYDPVPDDPSQLREATQYANQRRQQEIMQANAAAAPSATSSSAPVASAGEPAAFQCSVNGRTWVQATPCPAISKHFDPVFVSGTTDSGQFVTGTGEVERTVPVQQQGMSKEDLCTKLRTNPKTGEHADSTYERNKLRTANGC